MSPSADGTVPGNDGTYDDIVRYKSVTPEKYFTVEIGVRMMNYNRNARDPQVKLICPSGRIRFITANGGASGATSTTITLPSDGEWKYLFITGFDKSYVKGDAIIKAVKPDGSGSAYGTANATVFWFADAKMEPEVTSNSFARGSIEYMTTGDQAVILRGGATLMPSGLSPDAPQIKRLKLTFEQTIVSSRKSATLDTPVPILWNPNVTSANVPNKIDVNSVLTDVCDSENDNWVPVYIKSDPASYFTPLTKMRTDIQASDSPGLKVDNVTTQLVDRFNRPTVVVKYTYKQGSSEINMQFRDWTVIYDEGEKGAKSEWLSEGSWSLDARESLPDQKPASGTKNQKPTLSHKPQETGHSANSYEAPLPVTYSTEATLMTNPKPPQP